LSTAAADKHLSGCDAIANVECFPGLRETSDSISIVAFTSAMRRHLVQLPSVPFTSIVWQSFLDLRALNVMTLSEKQASDALNSLDAGKQTVI